MITYLKNSQIKWYQRAWLWLIPTQDGYDFINGNFVIAKYKRFRGTTYTMKMVALPVTKQQDKRIISL